MLDVGLPAVGQIDRHTAGADVVVVHPQAGDLLEEAEDFFALAPAVDHHRDGTEIHAVGGHEQQVRAHAVELAHQHADPRRPLRNLNTEQLFGGETEGEFGEERRGVVHAGDVGAPLQIGELLGLLFHAGVEIADDRLTPQHRLALHLQHQAKDTVGRRVRGAHVEHDPLVVVARFWVIANLGGFGLGEAQDGGAIVAAPDTGCAVGGFAARLGCGLRVLGDRHRSLLAALNCTGMEPTA